VTAPRFPVLVVDVSEADADLASGTLFDLGATGIEVRDATTLEKGQEGRVTLVASFEDDESAQWALGNVPDAWDPKLDAIVGDAWRDEYKKYFHPFAICKDLVVRPPWEPYAAKEGERVLLLEPGRAFGTGLHETTSLVAEVLSERAAELRGRPLLDVGTGSGILALIALLLGAERARAIDVDADAVRVARENALANGLGGRFDASTTPLSAIPERYPFLVANIEASVLASMVDELSDRVQPGAVVVLSGILAPPSSAQVPELLATYARFQHVETKIRGEWAALVLRARDGTGTRGESGSRRDAESDECVPSVSAARAPG
jgi:ribosomal protein L11 methyltransferase